MHPSSRPFWFWAIPVNIVIIALITVGILALDEGGEQSPVAGGAPSATAEAGPRADEVQRIESTARRDAEDPYALGQVDAPVAMVVYSDYQCPYCAQHAATTEIALIEEYVNAGTLRIEWRDMDFFGDDSNRAARAAWAAGRQSMYHEYHGALFGDGEQLGPADLTEEELLALAEQFGLDEDAFRADMESAEAAAWVEANVEEASSIGAFNTPSFLINGQPLAGALPAAEFEAAIELAAEAAPYDPEADPGSGSGSGSGQGSGASTDPAAEG